jgi:hypothetical protein
LRPGDLVIRSSTSSTIAIRSNGLLTNAFAECSFGPVYALIRTTGVAARRDIDLTNSVNSVAAFPEGRGYVSRAIAQALSSGAA